MESTVKQNSRVPIRPKPAKEERSSRTEEVTKDNAQDDSSGRVDESAYSNTNILVRHEIPDENKNPPLQYYHNRSSEWWT
jgi:hypothetical protein